LEKRKGKRNIKHKKKGREKEKNREIE